MSRSQAGLGWVGNRASKLPRYEAGRAQVGVRRPRQQGNGKGLGFVKVTKGLCARVQGQMAARKPGWRKAEAVDLVSENLAWTWIWNQSELTRKEGDSQGQGQQNAEHN